MCYNIFLALVANLRLIFFKRLVTVYFYQKLRAQDRIVSPKEQVWDIWSHYTEWYSNFENIFQDERGHILDAQATKYASGDQSGTFKPVVTERKVEYNNWSVSCLY